MNEFDALWTYDLLWSKARLYIARALDAPRDAAMFPFWCALALEMLARTALASIHPALLADTPSRDCRSLLYAFGLPAKTANFAPKSITAAEAYSRCGQVIPEFTKEIEGFCIGLATTRNEELHTGGLPFERLMRAAGWLPRFHAACKALLAFHGKDLTDFLGDAEASVAERLIAAQADEAAKSVRKLIALHMKMWNSKSEKDRQDLQEAANKWATPSHGHVVECPACGSRALLKGEIVREQPPKIEDDEVVVREIILPTAMLCAACDLAVKGHSLLQASGLGDPFTNTHRFDPFTYYYSAEPVDEGDYYNE